MLVGVGDKVGVGCKGGRDMSIGSLGCCGTGLGGCCVEGADGIAGMPIERSDPAGVIAGASAVPLASDRSGVSGRGPEAMT